MSGRNIYSGTSDKGHSELMKTPGVHASVMCVCIITMHAHINIRDRSINHAQRARAWQVYESKSMSC